MHNSVPVNNSDYAKDPSESSSDSSILSLADLNNQVQEIATTSVDEIDGNSIIIDEPAPLPNHISESSLSSLPSTPPLPQSQFTSFYSSPQISSSFNPLMTTTTSASAPSLTLVQVSRPDYSSLLFVFFAYCLQPLCFPAGIQNPEFVYTTIIFLAYIYSYSKNCRVMIMRKLLDLLPPNSYDNPR